jgi:AP-1 complex subunit mu
MDDLKFHQCVDMRRFQSERLIEFTPPDGEFELMNYRLNTQLRPLIFVEANIEKSTETRIEYLIKAKSNYRKTSIAHGVEIAIPVPNDLKNPVFRTPNVVANYFPDKDCVIWKVRDFPGQTELNLKIEFLVPTIRNNSCENYLKKPIAVKFEIPSFTVSGMQVKYLKIEGGYGYRAFPYVKYNTTNGDYYIRMV